MWGIYSIKSPWSFRGAAAPQWMIRLILGTFNVGFLPPSLMWGVMLLTHVLLILVVVLGLDFFGWEQHILKHNCPLSQVVAHLCASSNRLLLGLHTLHMLCHVHNQAWFFVGVNLNYVSSLFIYSSRSSHILITADSKRCCVYMYYFVSMSLLLVMMLCLVVLWRFLWR